MKAYYVIYALLTTMLLTLTSCPGTESGPDTSDEGYVKGRVTDEKNNPLAGVEIIIDNTYLPNSNLLSNTDQDGKYSIKLPGTAATYMAYAKLHKTYNGKQYTLDLHPESIDGFAQQGAIRNFQWKLTGKKPEPLLGIYGGLIQIDKEIESTLYDVENIEFTLVPEGVLINGSTGKTLYLKPGLPHSDTYSQLADVPIGRYTISAVYKSTTGDKPVKLRNRLDPNSPFVNSIQLDFEPQTFFCFNCMQIEYKE